MRLLVSGNAPMLVVNFSHPLTPSQREQLAGFCGRSIDRVIDVKVQFRHEEPFGPQAVAAVDAAGLAPAEWQTLPLVVVPPALAPIACACLAELHGRIGHFPPIVRLRPRPDATPPVFDVAELVNLQQVRERGRERR
jgi:hypothetical protein